MQTHTQTTAHPKPDDHDHPKATTRLRAIFSDLDGTLVHFPAWFNAHGATLDGAVVRCAGREPRACRLLPSSTMGDGCVSERTVQLVDALRAEGVLFVVVTAARKSTLLERLPLLPRCDVAVCETGSRIYEVGADGALTLDQGWAERLAPVCGPLERAEPPEERPEPLWALYRALRAAGFFVDGRSYYGCFRCDTRGDAADEERLRALLARVVPAGVAWAMNLGKYDFFPEASGKGNAVAYLQARLGGLEADECAALFDDDNDLPMAARCGTRMLPGLTSESVRYAVAEHPEWEVAPSAGLGVYAIEELLEELLARVRQQ